jgi:hypothetical protein
MEMNSYAKVPLNKIVIGKPLDAGKASNGYVSLDFGVEGYELMIQIHESTGSECMRESGAREGMEWRCDVLGMDHCELVLSSKRARLIYAGCTGYHGCRPCVMRR